MDQLTIEGRIKEIFRAVLREELPSIGGDDRLLTADEVKEQLALKNTRSVYRLGREKMLTPLRISKNCVRFRRSEVQQYIASLGQSESKSQAKVESERAHQYSAPREDSII